MAASHDVSLPEKSLSYADIADLVAPADLILSGKVRSLIALKNPVPAPPPNRIRYYAQVTADSVIRAPGALPPTLAFLIDLPNEKGAPRALKGKTFLFFGHPGQRQDQFQLLSSLAYLPALPDTLAQVRAIAAEVVASDAAPPITGIDQAFHVAGTVAGESETQIFLRTATGRPISLSISRRPDEMPHFGASLGEVVSENAGLPEPDTLLWYRLACTLPDRLPQHALSQSGPGDADAARADFGALRDRLGPCLRTRPPLALGKDRPAL